MKRIALFLLLICLFGNNVKAGLLTMQYEKVKPTEQYQLSRHFIIAIDGAMPAYTAELQKTTTKEYVEQLLNNYFCFNSNDFLSIVTYQIDLSNPDFNRFAYVPKDRNGKRIKWRKQEKACFSDFGQWADIVAHQQNGFVGTNKASFQSAAKPFILQAVVPESEHRSISGYQKTVSYEDVTAANVTYIIMLSDDEVNGTDDNYKSEWKNISTAEGSNLRSNKHDSIAVFSKLKNINRRFHFESVKFGRVDKHTFAHISKYPFTLSIYKVCPTTIPSIQSITDIPAQLPFRKVRGGYDLYLELNNRSNDYTIIRLELALHKNNLHFSNHTSSIQQDIKRSQLSEGDTVSLRAWATYNDGYYNGFIFSPYDSDYTNSLTLTQAVTLKDDTKIFGKMPVADCMWWFWPHDIQSIVIFWDIVLILIFIALIAFILYKGFVRINKYKPSNKDITITKV